MKKLSLLVIAVSFGAIAGVLSGCSSGPFATANRNLLATICANGAVIQAQLPTGVLTPAQVAGIQNLACSTAFGTTAAPAPASGMSPVFPGPTVSPTPAPAPAPTVKIPASLVGGAGL